jgi:hypothetical protein
MENGRPAAVCQKIKRNFRRYGADRGKRKRKTVLGNSVFAVVPDKPGSYQTITGDSLNVKHTVFFSIRLLLI